jgi:hypothetical protein
MLTYARFMSSMSFASISPDGVRGDRTRRDSPASMYFWAMAREGPMLYAPLGSSQTTCTLSSLTPTSNDTTTDTNTSTMQSDDQSKGGLASLLVGVRDESVQVVCDDHGDVEETAISGSDMSLKTGRRTHISLTFPLVSPATTPLLTPIQALCSQTISQREASPAGHTASAPPEPSPRSTIWG